MFILKVGEAGVGQLILAGVGVQVVVEMK